MSLYNAIRAQAKRDALDVFGAFHPGAQDAAPKGTGTVVLLGPDEPGFWDQFRGSPEYNDAQPDPLDRWSRRVIAAIANAVGAQALFPFGGPPYRPFIAWAQRSGQAWQSPAGLLVHDSAGLMVSYRGALALPDRLELPAPGPCPCDTCADRPCLRTCPVNALSAAKGYDVAACHGFLDSAAGNECLTSGCQARRACPVSTQFGRLPAQSAFHMKAFHP